MIFTSLLKPLRCMKSTCLTSMSWNIWNGDRPRSIGIWILPDLHLQNLCNTPPFQLPSTKINFQQLKSHLHICNNNHTKTGLEQKKIKNKKKLELPLKIILANLRNAPTLYPCSDLLGWLRPSNTGIETTCVYRPGKQKQALGQRKEKGQTEVIKNHGYS